MKWLLGILDFFALPQTKVGVLAVAASLAAAFGMPDKYSGRIDAVVTAICTLSAMAIAGISYERGKLVEGTVPDGRRSINDPPAGNVATPVPPNTPTLQSVEQTVASKHNIVAKILILPFLLSLVMAIAGCASQMTPLTRADLAATSLDGAVKTLTTARKAGLIADSDKANISAALHAADTALHTYEADVIADPNGAETQRDAAAFWSAFANVEPYVVKYLSKPTTKASN